MVGEINHESGFSRSLANHAKLGAYYTDMDHCLAMRKFLNFPQEEDVLCLEPSIGDGIAIKSCTGKKEGDNIHIYGVDLSKEAVEETRSDPLIEQVLQGDFIRDVNISQKVFSFIFSNPPYMVADDEMRYEEKFLDRFTPLLKKDGVLFYVIPYGQFVNKRLFLKLINRYEIKHVFRFHEQEYVKWHQVVIMATKRSANAGFTGSMRDAVLEKYLIEEDIPVLPFDYDGEKLDVPGSSVNALVSFCPVVFPADKALAAMTGSHGLASEILQGFHRAVDKRISIEPWKGAICGYPPIHPNKGSMYLLGVCGAGAGICGDAAAGNLHLERGVVKMREYEEESYNEKTDSSTIVVTRRAQITYNVIEANGQITNLE